MKDDRADVHRVRSASASGAIGHGRRRFPEKLVDGSRRVQNVGQVHADNGSPISPELANVVAKKACLLEAGLENMTTGGLDTHSGQAGLIRGISLAESPQQPPKKQAVAKKEDEKPTAVIPAGGSGRFETTPITCIHNVEDDDIDGVSYEFRQSSLFVVAAGLTEFRVEFEGAGYTPEPNEEITLRQQDGENDPITWQYHDVTKAGKCVNTGSSLTLSFVSFELVRDDFEFQPGQKIGMAVYRKFEVTPEDAGVGPQGISDPDELRKIFGREDDVNIYTGKIVNVVQDKQTFEHNINSYRGCSGAVIFLLDRGQNGNGVKDSDHGKAIAVHAGGDELADGTIINSGPKIRPGIDTWG